MRTIALFAFAGALAALTTPPAVAAEAAKDAPAGAPAKAAPRVQFQRDDDKGVMRVLVDGKEGIVYQYGRKLDLPHYWPVRGPSGESMTVQQTNPYPHHRSFWFADTVRLAGQERQVSTYNAFYSKKNKADPQAEFPDRIRHVEFLPSPATPSAAKNGQAEIACRLVWEMDFKTPVLDETRLLRVVPLSEGEYFLDVTFTVTASYGDVEFLSDRAHYAWPYVRMNDTYNVQKGGGTITNSEGKINQKGTENQPAKWIDYSAPVQGKAEGLAIFSHTDNPQPHRWLTRDYGCFGPRRQEERSGKRFTLAKGQSLKRRVGILVHNGDVKAGKVAERYEQYVQGKL